ncbi:MAG: hypothetical protein PHW77_02335, partial [Eubacteriales bacterium]|nr:hypothetical protein [Eubacteriales bacterium]
MRKFMALALSVLLVAACFVSVIATAVEDTGFRVSASSPATVAAGQTYDLTVKIDTLPTLESGHVSAIAFKVGFDKSLVSIAVTTGKSADFTTTATGLDDIVSVEDGYIEATFMDYSFGDKFAVDQTITFHFTVNAAAAAGAEIDFDVYDVQYTVGTAMTTFIDGTGVDCQSAIPSNPNDPDLTDLWDCFNADGFSLVNIDSGVFQSGGKADTSSYKFQGYCDGEFLYGAIVTLYDPIGDTTDYGNSKGTNVRLWFRTNGAATIYTHFADISFTGYESNPVLGGKKNSSLTTNAAVDLIATDGIVTESVAEEGYWFIQYKIPLANIEASSTFQYFVCVSNGVDTANDIQNDALFYPAIPVVEGDRLANFPYRLWNDSAIVVPLKGVTSSADVIFNSSNLYKLSDGVYADDATAFSDERLVSFQWENFDKTEGAENGTREFTLLLDLVDQKGITGVKIGAYKDLNSFINLPVNVKIYLSNDGVNYVYQATGSWASSVEGLVSAAERDSGHLGACTYTANWSTRTALEARYVKLVLTINDEWVFLSEVEAVTTEGATHAVDEVELTGVNCPITSESVVVLTSVVGTLDMGTYNSETTTHTYAAGDYGLVSAGVLTWAKWDAAKKAYVVYQNEVNPWPNTRQGTITIAEDEILIASVSNGAIPALGAGNKWVMWHLEVGTELHIYNDIIAIGKTVEGKRQRVFNFTAPDYAPANTTTDVGIMAIDEYNFEGITSIHTSGTFNSAWRAAALLEYDFNYEAFKVIATCPSGATGPDWTIGENQIVVESNGGNNWPSLFAGATGTEWYYDGSNAWGTPYSECPSFINAKNGAWFDAISSMTVGSYYKLVGVDFSNPEVISNYAIEPSYDYITYNDAYATYTYLTPFN